MDDRPGEPPEAVGGGMSRRRVTVILAVVGLAVLCMIGSAVGYFWYDRATSTDRSTPRGVLLQYLLDRSDQENDRAALLVCGDAEIDQLDALFAELDAREQQFEVDTSVLFANVVENVGASESTIDADLIVTTRDGSAFYRETHAWNFAFTYEDGGWLLCRAQRRG
jgi:hypothetical protein